MQELIDKYTKLRASLITAIDDAWPDDGDLNVDPEFWDEWRGMVVVYDQVIKDLQGLLARSQLPS